MFGLLIAAVFQIAHGPMLLPPTGPGSPYELTGAENELVRRSLHISLPHSRKAIFSELFLGAKLQRGVAMVCGLTSDTSSSGQAPHDIPFVGVLITPPRGAAPKFVLVGAGYSAADALATISLCERYGVL